MALPSDFATTLAQFEKSGILAEDARTIEQRLALSIQGVALKTGQRGVNDLGIGDWTLGVMNRLFKAVHKEICDREKKALKEDYQELLSMGLTPEGVTAVSAAVVAVVSTINPAFAVSNVVIFITIWLLRRGLNQWCATTI